MFAAQALKSLNEQEMLVYQYVMEHRFAVPYMADYLRSQL